MNAHVLFFIGYGLLGSFPLLQLLVVWTFLDPDQIGTLLAVSATAVVTAAFCDGALAYRNAGGGAHTPEGRAFFLKVGTIRLTRLALLTPVIVVAYTTIGSGVETSISICLLAASYCLNFSFIDRLSGSAVNSLRDDAITRAHCQFLPSILTILEPRHGTIIGCALSAALQAFIVYRKFRIHVSEIRFKLTDSFSPDLMSGFLGLLHSSFCQVVASLTLLPAQFAVFGSIDRIVRASLLVSEPARLLALRWANLNKGRMHFQVTMFMIATGVALAVALALAIPFHYHIEYRILSIRMPFMAYLLVGSCTTFISICSLCIFIRQGLFRKLNWLYSAGILAGAMAYTFSYSQGPFVASLLFEATVFVVIAAGSASEALKDERST